MAGKDLLSAALLLSVAPGLGTYAAGPELEIRWSVNGGRVNTATPEGTTRDGGAIIYVGSLTDPATDLVLQFDFTGVPLSGVEGNVNIFNDLEQEIEVSIDVLFPLGVTVKDESMLRGSGVVGLTGGVGGATLSSLPSPPWVWRTLIDDQPAGMEASLFYHPFELSMSGPGNAAAFGAFGSPDPVSGPPISHSVGFSINFALTELDFAAVTSNIVMMNCPGDQDGDGIVSAPDLTALLALWGPCPPGPCDADLNGDGVVATDDLLLLLAMWGDCPLDTESR